jgi:hypothetical protein
MLLPLPLPPVQEVLPFFQSTKITETTWLQRMICVTLLFGKGSIQPTKQRQQHSERAYIYADVRANMHAHAILE